MHTSIFEIARIIRNVERSKRNALELEKEAKDPSQVLEKMERAVIQVAPTSEPKREPETR